MLDDCIFCRIVAGELPAARLYEDEHVLAFLDIRPLRPGHALVIPKAHCADLRDCPAEAAGPLLETVGRLAPALAEAVGATGFNLFNTNGAVAGQEVFHLHLHVLPREEGDGFFATSLRDAIATAAPATPEELAALAARVRPLLG